ncbi:carboxylesterase/lipase family protein [Streptomyces aurantiogriseus]|uniref:Carboxylic ester hydrolase n=1 Tax=Streptomyces aurantiogriseus TaxID=66870 RepID=A0A918C458_9ACTN|nr:carboxylesterase family protein [Streptomyces aurantiogriseus]GGR02751.1 carboxylic ester hydrolase [Streptomyces aurantiogriseus]
MTHAETHDAPPTRRTVIAGTALALAAAAVPAVASAASSAAGPVTRTTAGRIAGERAGRTVVFRGVPYAQAPTGALRFSSPRPPRPWRGVRDATRFAPPSYQSVMPGSSEDSLYANIWTPDLKGSRPVMVYIHGGGWFVGAGSHPLYDGQRPADRGDMVVITFNYRLGAFGWGLHEDLTDPATGSFANWGLQDQAALLHWVRANAAAFGGDPDNITVCGTSAGGSSAWQLSLLPEMRTVIRRIVAISTAHAWTPAVGLTAADATETYERIAHRLGTTVPGLRHADAASVKDAWEALFSGPPEKRALGSGREYQGPVVDGRWMPAFDHERPTPGVPVLSVHTRMEGSFFTGPGSPTPQPAPTDETELRTAVRNVLLKGVPEVPGTLVERCLADYREAAAADGLPDDPLTLWTEIWGDGLFRRPVVRFAERHARIGTSPLYVMDFGHPVYPPHFGTPHEATSRFLFGTHRLPEEAPVYGDGPLERRISDTFIDLVSSFARGQAPAAPGVDPWPVFAPGRPSALVLGGPDVARIGDIPKSRQLRFWDEAGWGPRI